jgi:hypothetical protein
VERVIFSVESQIEYEGLVVEEEKRYGRTAAATRVVSAQGLSEIEINVSRTYSVLRYTRLSRHTVSSLDVKRSSLAH